MHSFLSGEQGADVSFNPVRLHKFLDCAVLQTGSNMLYQETSPMEEFRERDAGLSYWHCKFRKKLNKPHRAYRCQLAGCFAHPNWNTIRQS